MTNINLNIRYANIDDTKLIMDFIKNNWAEKHILANNKEFFLYEFSNEKEKVNFVVAEDSPKNIQAILGFIEYGKTNSNIMTVMWKSISKTHPFLGVDLLRFLENDNNFKIISSVGINKKTERIYKYLGLHTGKLNHYYRLSNKEVYKIANIKQKNILKIENKLNYRLKKLKKFKDLLDVFDFEVYKASNPNPYKEPWYIEKRYFNHPIYNYQVFGIEEPIQRKIKSWLVCREVQVEGTKILRVVDFLGDINELNYISFELDELLKSENYEYIDFYQYGIAEEIMNNAGFVKKIEDHAIIPNYFEPYDLKNIDIYFFTTNAENLYLFKADCDQDRPNYFVEG